MSGELIVACVLVRGHVGYTVKYVERLQRMVARYVTRPHRFLCLSDQELTPGLERLAVPTMPRGMFAWWAKLGLFAPAFDAIVGEGSRVLYLDLDVLITRDLSPVIDFPGRFGLVPDGAPNFHGKGARHVVKRFNSSVMVWTAGAQRHLFERFTPAVTERLWGDQDWIGEQCPNATAMPAEWFPRLSALLPRGYDAFPYTSINAPHLGNETKVVLCKKPKNSEAARWPWFNTMWGGWDGSAGV